MSVGAEGENERGKSCKVFERGRASRKIDRIDKIARPRLNALAVELSTGSVDSSNDQDPGLERAPRKDFAKFCGARGARMTRLMSVVGRLTGLRDGKTRQSSRCDAASVL